MSVLTPFVVGSWPERETAFRPSEISQSIPQYRPDAANISE
jgi:hypothetical protein